MRPSPLGLPVRWDLDGGAGLAWFAVSEVRLLCLCVEDSGLSRVLWPRGCGRRREVAPGAMWCVRPHCAGACGGPVCAGVPSRKGPAGGWAGRLPGCPRGGLCPAAGQGRLSLKPGRIHAVEGAVPFPWGPVALGAACTSPPAQRPPPLPPQAMHTGCCIMWGEL